MSNITFIYIFQNCSTKLLPVFVEPELPKLMNPAQRFLLATQFRQHVQLMVQHFVMTYMHPEYHSLSKICKQNLNSLRYDGDEKHNISRNSKTVVRNFKLTNCCN